MTKPLLIIKTGSKLATLAHLPGDFEDWIAHGLGIQGTGYQVVDALHGVLPPHHNVCGILITGSGAMVTDRLPWVERTAEWLNEAVLQGVPVLGICFGHQLLAHALGGIVDWNPRGVEVGTVRIHLTPAAYDDVLFQHSSESFAAQASHRQTVVTLPPHAIRLGYSDLDEHHAFRYGAHAWGVQFHPEFDPGTTATYIQHYQEYLTQLGQDSELLARQVLPTPESKALLARFAAICLDKERAAAG